MVDAEASVVIVAVIGLRVLRVVEGAAHAPGNVKGAGDAEHTQGVEAVGVLHDFRFQRGRRDVGGKAMGFDGVGDGGDFCLAPIQLRQYP
ncbi:hypothetical protein D3C84_1048410 [compost metagenome]